MLLVYVTMRWSEHVPIVKAAHDWISIILLQLTLEQGGIWGCPLSRSKKYTYIYIVLFLQRALTNQNGDLISTDRSLAVLGEDIFHRPPQRLSRLRQHRCPAPHGQGEDFTCRSRAGDEAWRTGRSWPGEIRRVGLEERSLLDKRHGWRRGLKARENSANSRNWKVSQEGGGGERGAERDCVSLERSTGVPSCTTFSPSRSGKRLPIARSASGSHQWVPKG